MKINIEEGEDDAGDSGVSEFYCRGFPLSLPGGFPGFLGDKQATAFVTINFHSPASAKQIQVCKLSTKAEILAGGLLRDAR